MASSFADQAYSISRKVDDKLPYVYRILAFLISDHEKVLQNNFANSEYTVTINIWSLFEIALMSFIHVRIM